MPPLNTFQRGCVALAVSQAITLPLQAATITVTSNADTSGTNANICTLRDAVTAANEDAQVIGSSCTRGNGDDTIEFSSFLSNQTITLSGSALPPIESTITINGSGRDQTEINGGGNRIIFIDSQLANLTLDALTLTGGEDSRSGLIYANNPLTITNSAVSGYIYAGSSSILTLTDTTVSGSGVQINNGASLSMTDSTVSGSNLSINDGESLSMTDSTVSGSSLSISNIRESGSATLTNITVSGSGGVGIYATDANVTLMNITVSGSGGDGISARDANVTLVNSTVSGSGGDGISSRNANVTLTNSTVSANSGSGIVARGGTVTLLNSTLSDNSSFYNGGGISATTGASVTLLNSMVSGNSAPNTGSEIFAQSDSPLTLNNSLVGHSGVTLNEALSGYLPNSTNIVATMDGNAPTPLADILSPLADNGGPTQTHGLPVGSPAINAGDNATCQSTDQRGEARLNNTSDPCDIGAFEGAPEPDTSFFVVPLPNGRAVIFGL